MLIRHLGALLHRLWAFAERLVRSGAFRTPVI